jgi:hypothetical protein
MRSKSRGNKISSKDFGQRKSECPAPYLAQRRGGNDDPVAVEAEGRMCGQRLHA